MLGNLASVGSGKEDEQYSGLAFEKSDFFLALANLPVFLHYTELL